MGNQELYSCMTFRLHLHRKIAATGTVSSSASDGGSSLLIRIGGAMRRLFALMAAYANSGCQIYFPSKVLQKPMDLE